MMKAIVLFLGTASMISGEAVRAPEACPAPAAAGEKGGHTRFDPLMVDLNGDGVARTAPQTCATATAAEEVKLKGPKGDVKVSASQNSQTLRHAINTKGTGTSGRAESTDHAINTKGTGAAGRVKGTTAINNDVPVRATHNTQVLRHAISTKGAGTAAGEDEDCDDVAEASASARAINCAGVSVKSK